MEETSFTMDGLQESGLVCDIRRRNGPKHPKNVDTRSVERVKQIQESSFQVDDDVDPEVVEIENRKRFGHTQELGKLEEESLDAQECTGNTEQLVKEETDHNVKAEKECPANLKVDRPETESKSGCFQQIEDLQEGGNPTRVTFWWILKTLLMCCGGLYIIWHISGKQMMQSLTTDPMNGIPESAKGGLQSHVDQFRNKPLQHHNAKKSTSQLLDSVKDIPEDKLEGKRDVYYYTEVKVREPSYLHRGQHVTMPRKILGYEMYRHHAIVLNVTLLGAQKVELTLIGYSKDKQMNYTVHRKMPVLKTTSVYDQASDDLRIIQYVYPVFSPNEIAERAESEKEKSKDYNFFFNNCEHFSTYAAYGFSKSLQVERFFHNIWRLFICLVIFLVVIHFCSRIFAFIPSLQKTISWLDQKNNWMKVLMVYFFNILLISCKLTIFVASLLLLYYYLMFWIMWF